MADVKWIKICTDIFDDEKILLIEAMPDKYAIITVWFKLLCFAGKQNNGGVFMLNDKVAYTDEMLATIFRMNLNTVRLSLDTFERFGMIEIIEGVITIPNWEKHQSADRLEVIREQTRKRVSEYRKRQKALLLSNVTNNVEVTQCNDIELEQEKELNSELEINNKKRGVFQDFAGEDIELLNALREFNEYRNKKKKPLTDEAKARLCKKLETFPREQWVAIIQQSIDNGWTGLYKLSGQQEVKADKYSSETSFTNAIADLMNG